MTNIWIMGLLKLLILLLSFITMSVSESVSKAEYDHEIRKIYEKLEKLDQLQYELDETRKENKILDENIQNLQKQNQDFQEAIVSLEHRCHNLESDVEKLRKERQKIKTKTKVQSALNSYSERKSKTLKFLGISISTQQGNLPDVVSKTDTDYTANKKERRFRRVTTCSSSPPTISNGYESHSTSYVTYYCNTGYFGSGTNIYSCLWAGPGYWPTINFTCRIRNCGTPPTLSNGNRSYSNTTYGSTAYYHCNTGYSGSGISSTWCQNSGTWSTLGYKCTIKDCGTPPTLSNGNRSYSSTTYGSTAYYHCNTGGYIGSGINSTWCQNSGTWSTLGYKCTIKDCGTPSDLTNGNVSYNSTTYGSTAEYFCNSGYVGVGNTQDISCQSSGNWSSLSYVCYIDCGTPPTLSNAYRSYNNTTDGSAASYQCNIGYTGSGINSTSCQSSGNWSTLGYKCTIKDCGAPPSLPYGYASYSTTTYGSTAAYFCNSDYIGVGSTQDISCQSSGNWTFRSYACYKVHQTIHNHSIGFLAYNKIEQHNLGIHQTVEFPTALTNEGSAYNPSSSIFRAPVDGLYSFSVTIRSFQGEDLRAEIVHNGNGIVYTYSGGESMYGSGSTSAVLKLQTNDDVWIRILDSKSTNNGNIRVYGNKWSSFSGFKIA